MGRRAKRGSLLLLAVGVAGAAAIVAIHGAGDAIWIVGAEGGMLRRKLER